MNSKRFDSFRRLKSSVSKSSMDEASTVGTQSVATFSGDFSSQQLLFDDVTATKAKLRDAAASGAQRDRWQPIKHKGDVTVFQLHPNWSEDSDVADAVVGRIDIQAHLNEVLSIFISHDSHDLDSTMRALYGKQFKRADVVLAQCDASPFTDEPDVTESARKTTSRDVAKSGQFGVQLEVLRPKGVTDFGRRHRRTQNLCFETFTKKSANGTQAIHLKKTMPKPEHDKLVDPKDRSALRNNVDHIGVGYEMKALDETRASGLGPKTRIFVHAYASTTAASAIEESVVGIRKAVNPEAYELMEKTVKSLDRFESVIRRRRLGFQTFVSQHPDARKRSMSGASCNLCNKSFKFFTKDYFCQLCGNVVCGDCSGKYDVEPKYGVLVKRRICTMCVVRTDACNYEDDLLYLELGPDILPVDEDEWNASFHYSPTGSDGTIGDYEEMHDQFVDLTHEKAEKVTEPELLSLDLLDTLLSPVNYNKESPVPKTQTRQKRSNTSIRKGLESYLDNEIRGAAKNYPVEKCELASKERDYVFEYDASKTEFKEHPLAPKIEENKDNNRVKNLEKTGMLDETHDRTALNMIAEVVATRMNCNVGFVSILDKENFYAAGTYQLDEIAWKLGRDESMCSHSLYAEKPFVTQDARRDVRFSHNSLVNPGAVKYYASFPVYAPDGTVVAGLCACDWDAKGPMTTKQYATMQSMSKLTTEFLFPSKTIKPILPKN